MICTRLFQLPIVVLAVSLVSPVPAAGPFEIIRFGIVHVGEELPDGEIRWIGTGFLVDSRCTLVTAKHVLSGVQRRERLSIRVQSPANPSKAATHPVRVLHEEPDSDLAFLVVDKIEGKPCDSDEHYIFPLVQATPSSRWVGASVAIIGFPVLGADLDIPVLRKGHISSVEISLRGTRVLLLDLHGVPGFSGSPVIIEETGEVIGVVYGPGPTQRNFGFEWATPVTRRHYEDARKVAK